MVEIYGKNNAIMSSVLYTFNDNRDNNDWNGFLALSTVNTRALGDTVETQVPLFDLGGAASDYEMKLVWQASDGNGNTDLADNIVSLTGEASSISNAVSSLVNEANTVNEGENIVIDGYFGDWNNIGKQFDYISNTDSAHVDLEQYAAVNQDGSTFMYMNVEGNILNGIAIPSYDAKSRPDLKTGSTGDTQPTAGVSNQQSSPLPVISSEDTIYVLIDTDNNPMTGYSSIGMGIGAEKMVEIKGHYGIITQRVMKDWTGTDNSDWEWATGEIVDAAASGSEIELEVVEGDFWIHIVGWNGEGDSSLTFASVNDLARYTTGGDTETLGYWNFNSNLNDATGTRNLVAAGDAARTSGNGGKMGEGLELDGSGDYAWKNDGTAIDLEQDWSMEAWVNMDDNDNGAIVFIGEKDDSDTATNEFSWSIFNGGDMHVAFDDCGGTKGTASTAEDLITTGVWHHVAISYDDSANDIDFYVDNKRIEEDDSFGIDETFSETDLVIGSSDIDDVCSYTNRHGDFDGTIDDVRIVMYEKKAFAGGLMISKVEPSTDTVTLYNAAGATITVDGIELWQGSSRCGSEISGSLAAGATMTTTTCSGLSASKDALRLVDTDGDNDGFDTGASGNDKAWVIGGVCWNNDGGNSGSIDSDCNNSDDPLIASGEWAVNTAADLSEGDGDTMYLKEAGNNDEGVDDWYVPEFSTLLMPIASVLLIVGYNYRRRETEE